MKEETEFLLEEDIRFLSLFKKFIAYYEDPELPLEEKKKGTLRNYKLRYNLISRYLKEKKLRHLKASEFSRRRAKELYKWCLTWAKNDHAVRVTLLCRQILAFGVEKEIILKNELFEFKLRKDGRKKMIYLSPIEIKLIADYKFNSPVLKKTADTFLLQCYTGFDYGDVFAVRAEHIFFNQKDERFYLIKPRLKGIGKNYQEAIIPYFNKTKEIFERYNYVMPYISNSTYGRFLKEISGILNIEKTMNGRLARRTFGMVAVNHEGYSIEAVSKMMGHSTARTTEAYYVELNINVVSNEVARLGYN